MANLPDLGLKGGPSLLLGKGLLSSGYIRSESFDAPSLTMGSNTKEHRSHRSASHHKKRAIGPGTQILPEVGGSLRSNDRQRRRSRQLFDSGPLAFDFSTSDANVSGTGGVVCIPSERTVASAAVIIGVNGTSASALTPGFALANIKTTLVPAPPSPPPVPFALPPNKTAFPPGTLVSHPPPSGTAKPQSGSTPSGGGSITSSPLPLGKGAAASARLTETIQGLPMATLCCISMITVFFMLMF